MATQIVVLGAGYAGAGAIKRLEREVKGVDLIWISKRDHHLVLHEVHRVLRNPAAADAIAIPVDEIKSPNTRHIEGEVVNLDVEEHTIELADGSTIDYDYVLVALGSQTPYYGIPGMESHAFTLKCLDDAIAIHEAVEAAVRNADATDPARVVVGGAGLSGVQSAGELAAFRDEHDEPLEIHLVEALPEILPAQEPTVQTAIRRGLEDRGVTIHTDAPIVEVDTNAVHVDEGEEIAYDVLVWTGGITGHDALETADVAKEHNRVNADATFRTSDERVFAIGDAAVVDQGGSPAPPTAQAAWQAAEVAAGNVARMIEGAPLESWSFDDKGTLISIGDDAIAHDVKGVPVSTFGSLPAEILKKFVAARWIADLTSWNRARKAWPYL